MNVKLLTLCCIFESMEMRWNIPNNTKHFDLRLRFKIMFYVCDLNN